MFSLSKRLQSITKSLTTLKNIKPWQEYPRAIFLFPQISKSGRNELLLWKQEKELPTVHSNIRDETQTLDSGLLLTQSITVSQEPCVSLTGIGRAWSWSFTGVSLSNLECFHVTSWRPYWCPKTIKRWPCWCPKPVLRELNSFLILANFWVDSRRFASNKSLHHLRIWVSEVAQFPVGNPQRSWNIPYTSCKNRGRISCLSTTDLISYIFLK